MENVKLLDVYFGNAEASPEDWRAAPDDRDPDDEELAETPPDVVKMLGFDPKGEGAGADDAFEESKHPRGQPGNKGQFGSGGGGSESTEAGSETSKPVGKFPSKASAAQYCRAVAKSLGYDESKVEVSEETKVFVLNGRRCEYAGAAYTSAGGDRPKGAVVIYPNSMGNLSAASVVAHEVMHQKFQAAFDALHDGDADAVAALGPLVADTGKLAKDDGVSNYSREWWESWRKGEATTLQAVHETLAEMASNAQITGGEKRLLGPDMVKSATGGAKIWRDLYKAVLKTYAKAGR